MNTSQNRERFVLLAEKRMTKVLKNIRLIGNLSNKTNYSYNEEDVKQIIRALKSAVRRVELKFQNKDKETEQIFKFKR